MLEQLGALLLSALLGAVVGWERFVDRKPAGLRTHTLVALGSTAFVLAGSALLGSNPLGVGDLSRVLQGVITGIGFLGAGTILHSGRNVQGLTTAATIWVSSAIGLAVGVRDAGLAIALTILTWLVLRGFRRIEVWYGGKPPRTRGRIRNGPDAKP
jgi:putative Mg2+ transporter-C (MgtC) family protein